MIRVDPRDIRIEPAAAREWAREAATAFLRRAEHDPRVLTGRREHYLLRIGHDVIICTDVLDECGELVWVYRYVLQGGDYAWVQ
jgi:hypothetical protein